MKLLETVPNVSEGRRADVVSALAQTWAGAGEVWLLDHSSDGDHNRSVFTAVGSPDGLHAALLDFFVEALARIDLSRHEGVHPRLGAVDVVPFVPLAGATSEDAIAAAQRLGREVARRHGMPVFLYEHAASRSTNCNLADIRRGGSDEVGARLRSGQLEPDFGPPVLHPAAGASVIGARDFLVAFNVVLDTPDIVLARAVARAVRAADGGLPALKALGIPLRSRGLTQVSMNLVDFRQTSLPAALDAVETEAAARGAGIVEAEIVGLAPAAAFAGASAADLRLPSGTGERVLERHLERHGLATGEDRAPAQAR